MQSHDFVEGVSGWRMTKGKLELYGGQYPVILGNLDEPAQKPVEKQPKPFIVVDGVIYISKAEVECGSFAGQVRDVIRVELKAGGLLHRSR